MDDVHEDTLDFVLDYTKGAPEQLFAVADAIDSKIVQTFAAASVVMGLAGVSDASVHGSKAVLSLFSLALVAYVVASLCSLRGLTSRAFRETTHADSLWPEFQRRPVADIKHSLVDDIAASFKHNREITDAKADWFRRGLMATAVEVVAVGLMVILSRLV